MFSRITKLGAIAVPSIALLTAFGSRNFLKLDSKEETIDLPLTFLPEVPPPVTRTHSARLRVHLTSQIEDMQVSPYKRMEVWTFNGSVPGPVIRARVGDTLEVHHTNLDRDGIGHNIDFHAATGPGGGAACVYAEAGETKVGIFKLLAPGVYVYHCAAGPVPVHIARGMYGMVIVDPEKPLPKVDREYGVMQSEIYGVDIKNGKELEFDYARGLDENPALVVFNGAEGSLVSKPLIASTEDRVRIFFANAGPNLISSFHIIGATFDKVYRDADLESPPARNLQTTMVPPGGATVVEFEPIVPGTYTLIDHAIFRMEKGCVGFLKANGPNRKDIFDSMQPPVGCPGLQDVINARGCSTLPVAGLSKQLVQVANQSTGLWARLDSSCVSLSDAAAAVPYLQKGAAFSLCRISSDRGQKIFIDSGLRSIAQQLCLYEWFNEGLCGITAAAPPGSSNHNGGAAVDIGDTTGWRSYFQNHGWAWQGPGDVMHYNYLAAADVRKSSVVAFQRLWNHNNPNNQIAVDGLYGPATQKAILSSPARGFSSLPVRETDGMYAGVECTPQQLEGVPPGAPDCSPLMWNARQTAARSEDQRALEANAKGFRTSPLRLLQPAQKSAAWSRYEGELFLRSHTESSRQACFGVRHVPTSLSYRLHISISLGVNATSATYSINSLSPVLVKSQDNRHGHPIYAVVDGSRDLLASIVSEGVIRFTVHGPAAKTAYFIKLTLESASFAEHKAGVCFGACTKQKEL